DLRLRDLIDVRRSKKTNTDVVEPQLLKRLLARVLLRPFWDVKFSRVLPKRRIFEEAGQIAANLVEDAELGPRGKRSQRIALRKKAAPGEGCIHEFTIRRQVRPTTCD